MKNQITSGCFGLGSLATSVRNCDGNLKIDNEPFARNELPLSGFSVIEAKNVEEVIELVSNTPCALAKGVIEIRPFWNINDEGE